MGGRVVRNRGDRLVVQGDGITEVRSGEPPLAWSRFVAAQSGAEMVLFEPPPALRNAVAQTSSARLTIQVERNGVHEAVLIETEERLFTEPEMESMVAALGGLAKWWHSTALSRAARNGGSGAATMERVDLRAKMDKLYVALEESVPSLLARPFYENAFIVGSVAVERARPSPKALLARAVGKKAILDRVVAPTVQVGDYAWLRGVIVAVADYAALEAGQFESGDTEITADHSSRVWIGRRRQLSEWLRHSVLATIRGRPPRLPSWVMSQSLPGARIRRALTDVPAEIYLVQGTGAGVGDGPSLIFVPSAVDSHIYELWLFYAVAQALVQRLGFHVTNQDAWMTASATDRAGEIASPLHLEWRGNDLAGQPLLLEALLEHTPSVQDVDGRILTPDIVLTISANGLRTRHVLDAKCKDDPAKEAWTVACGRYLRRLFGAPGARLMSAFVASPVSGAELALFSDSVRRAVRSHTAPQEQNLTSPWHAYAWGHLYARVPPPPAPPLGEFGQPGALGPLQWVTLALQYHRSELRHVCVDCSTVLSLNDTTLTGQKQMDDEKLIAHSDTADGYRLRSRRELRYDCPQCHRAWVRSVCANGHVLLKHGRLTPHVRRGERPDAPDPVGQNVECVLCGHFKGKMR